MTQANLYIFLFIICVNFSAVASLKSAFHHNSNSISKISTSQSNKILNTLSTCFKLLTPVALVSTYPNLVNAKATQGAIKTSSLAETKEAILLLKSCIESVKTMEKDAAANDFQAIGDKLSSSQFQNLENAATIMVRSDALSQEDKTTLGTIRRYGIVADALIMLGGLAGELKTGGITTDYGGNAKSDIEVADDTESGNDSNDDSEAAANIKVNASEVKRYIKLSKGSLEDIYNVVKPVLNKN